MVPEKVDVAFGMVTVVMGVVGTMAGGYILDKIGALGGFCGGLWEVNFAVGDLRWDSELEVSGGRFGKRFSGDDQERVFLPCLGLVGRLAGWSR